MTKFIFLILLLLALNISAINLADVTFSVSSEIDSNLEIIETVDILIPINSLIFKKEDNKFTSLLNIQYSFSDRKNNPIKTIFIDTSLILDNYNKTTSDSVFNITKSFDTDSNYSSMRIVVYDIQSANSISFDSDIIMPYSKENKSYIKKIKSIDDNKWHFLNADSISFSVDYSIINKENYQIYIKIFNKNKNFYSKTFDLKNIKSDTFNISANIDVAKYTLTVTLLENKKKISSVSTDFYIDFSFIYSNREYNDILNALAYFAVGTQVNILRNAKAEEREKLWTEFWNKAKENPVLSGHIIYSDFLKRYQYTNRYYSNYSKKGYKTDFGRIYILYGKPDEIEEHPFDLDSKPFVIWYYYSLGYNFRFVDRFSYGEYKLINYYEQLR